MIFRIISQIKEVSIISVIIIILIKEEVPFSDKLRQTQKIMGGMYKNMDTKFAGENQEIIRKV